MWLRTEKVIFLKKKKRVLSHFSDASIICHRNLGQFRVLNPNTSSLVMGFDYMMVGFWITSMSCFCWHVFSIWLRFVFAVQVLDEKMSSFSITRKKTPFQKHREEEEAKKKVWLLMEPIIFLNKGILLTEWLPSK